MLDLIESTLVNFLREFHKDPYLAYTEHGFHALFFHELMARIPEDELFGVLDGCRYLTVQKEYPTDTDLRKGKRQHWDISVIDRHGTMSRTPFYDHMSLIATIEFGLNASPEHLREDIRRMDEDMNSKAGYAVHLFRLSNGYSGRDRKPSSGYFKTPEEIKDILVKTSQGDKVIKVFYCAYGHTVDPEKNPCIVTKDRILPL